MPVSKAAVIGAGSWGTALARLLSEKGYRVTLWGHRLDHVAEIIANRENLTYLPGFKLNDNLTATADLKEAVAGHELVLMVVPSHGYREVFRRLLPHLEKNVSLISAVKGIENDTLMTMDQVVVDELGKIDAPPALKIGVLAGPSFAKEVAAGVPTAVTVAANTREDARFFQQVFNAPRFRVYASTDVIGMELCGALKNPIAIGAGICDGLGYGTNTRAALITRGLAEITRLGVRMGAQPLTFAGLAGMGDLVLTCTGDLSRNRQVGLKLGQGQKIKQIVAEMKMVAEGVKTTRSAYNLARKMNIEMPILEQVYQVIYEDMDCNEAVKTLLARSLKEEIEF
ncbi:MAG: NAD(P)-dependent glycerol-3-phosphate dehydrogenase [Proteobacteria bacterium]|nr:NAD(P)-dependent glycerol-3-phosphate dehydrogenase [Pseudomonadota bacterium]MBU1736817.1 NAD(P)-dependent glycerol-3-phosphate dehydrogenase [Pseudomonadota bacterium]